MKTQHQLLLATSFVISAFLISTSVFAAENESPVAEMDNLIAQRINEIKEQVGNNKVICGLSGGVDSSVVAQLLSLSLIHI